MILLSFLLVIIVAYIGRPYVITNFIRKFKGQSLRFPAIYDEEQKFINSHNWIFLNKSGKDMIYYRCTNCNALLHKYETYSALGDFSSESRKYRFKTCGQLCMEDILE